MDAPTRLAQALAAGIHMFGCEFRQLGLDDLAAMDVWLQDSYRSESLRWLDAEIARRCEASNPMPLSEQQRMREALFLSAARVGWNTPEGKQRLNTHEGLLFLLARASDGVATRQYLEAQISVDDPDAARKALEEIVEDLGQRIIALSEDQEAAPSGDGSEACEEADPTECPTTGASSAANSPNDMAGPPTSSGN